MQVLWPTISSHRHSPAVRGLRKGIVGTSKPTSTSYDVVRVPLFPIAPFILDDPFDPYDS